MVNHVEKRNGKTARFNPNNIRTAISKAVVGIHLPNSDEVTNTIYNNVLEKLSEFNGDIPKITEIEKLISKSARELGFENVSTAYIVYSEKRTEARKFLGVVGENEDNSSTDKSLLIESDTKDELSGWNRNRIVNQLELEANLDPELATDVAKNTENMIVDLYERGIRRLTTTDVRTLVDLSLRQEGLETQRRQQALLGLPSADLEQIIFSRSNENSNIASNNPEAVNLEIAERIQKPWALANIFSKEVADAHLNGEIHVHDLGYPTRVYCSAHSLEYIKKFGLNTVLGNLESKSDPPNSAAVLNQHVQTFLASMQAHYAGALGFGFLNIIYSGLLNRPVDVIKGKFRGKETTIEKRDLEKMMEQGVMSENKEDWDNYFEKIEETKEMREVSQREYDQTAQNLIFAASQNAFSRGGQTLFIDFNIHTGVPNYMKEVPAIGPGGKYMVQMTDKNVRMVDEVPRIKLENLEDKSNGNADNSQLSGELEGGNIITYGQLEPSAQRFAKSLLDVWRKGDKDGRPFHFPKADLHVDSHSYEDPKQMEVLDLATQIASENGSIYFMFDRGDDAVLAQCCRLKEKIEDETMLKYPERLRFCGFQNVTVNFGQAAYKGLDNKAAFGGSALEATLDNITHSMELALEAHKQKKEYMQTLLDTNGSPMRNLGKPSDDGEPYIDLGVATYIIGNIGLNEAVQALTGKQLHESEEANKMGLEIIAHMYKEINRFKDETGLKFTIEESPAESATRRFAAVDKKKFEIAKKVVKGTDENPYYSNSIHYAPDAQVSLVDRIIGQSQFHNMIASGAIVHAWTGEKRPSRDTIGHIVKQTLENTACSQLCFSPTYTECDACGTVMAGEKELCTTSSCDNHDEETLDKSLIHTVTRVVGYNSRTDHWNGSQQQIYEDRKIAEAQYAGESGIDMPWLYNPNGHDKLTILEFSKHGCPNCDEVETNIQKEIKRLGLEGQVEFKKHYLDDFTREGLVEAARHEVPLDVVPSLVIKGKQDYWKKTTSYGANSVCENGVCSLTQGIGKGNYITTLDIQEQIEKKASEYDLMTSVK